MIINIILKLFLIVVVIKCLTMEHRWEECIRLIDYAMKRINTENNEFKA